jgi:dCTP deaminase
MENDSTTGAAGCLTKKEILQVFNKTLFVRPLLDPEQITETGIDFRLGYDFLVSVRGREAFMNASKSSHTGKNQRNINSFFNATRRQLGETFILHPHQTVLATSLEYVKLPTDCMISLYTRSSYSRLGISISSVAQPGYAGCLSLELTNNNTNPVNLTVGARILQGLLIRMTGDTAYFNKKRKYTCQVRPEPSAVIQDEDLELLNNLWRKNNNRPEKEY